MSQPLILSIDEGTTNAKAMLVDRKGQLVAKSARSLQLFHPHPGWAEQDPEEIWAATKAVIDDCLSGISASQIKGVAISNQRESVLIWERESGKAITPLVSWQCRRTEQLCEEISQSPLVSEIPERTGLVIDPLFPATKIQWLLRSLPDGVERASRGELCAGTVDSWIVWKLTGGKTFATDMSNASRYQLFNLRTLAWDPLLLDLFQIPRSCLPEVLSSNGARGVVTGIEALQGLSVPVLSQIGDSHAALYGQGGFTQGIVKATYGTGSSLMTTVSAVPDGQHGVSTTVAWHDGEPSLAVEGNITHTGSAIKFMSTVLGISDIDELSELAWSVEDTNNVYFVPALAGLGAPYWDAKARGMITGLTDAATPAHIARSAFESVAYQVADLFFAMEKATGMRLEELCVDGGPTKNRELMQFQANLLQRKIIKRDVSEVSALGAAYLAGKAIGWWPDEATLNALLPKSDVILPDEKATLQIQEKYRLWKQAIKRARF